MDGTYCSKSSKCPKTYCPRHLGTFNAIYISLAEFNCEEVLNEQTTNNTNKETEYGC